MHFQVTGMAYSVFVGRPVAIISWFLGGKNCTGYSYWQGCLTLAQLYVRATYVVVDLLFDVGVPVLAL